MNLNKTQKILLGIFTIVPFILSGYIFYQILHFILSTVEASQGQEYEPSETAIIAGVLSFIVPIIILTFLSLFLHVFYIVHAALNKQLDQTEKILWILLFIFFGTIPFIIYWFIRLWNENQRPLTQGL